ncbi:MAG TPA: hypothetical protein VGX28_09455 [Frankiaceae bacterium]|nr:hypothetical protein [Frankiaceae bacterium]
MSCDPRRPCASGDPRLGLVPPPPGLTRLRRRSGDFAAFAEDLVRETEHVRGPDGGPLGAAWDVEGDPRAMRLVRLWAYVAETVAAYAELTANESYLATAADWTDLRRLAALVGYRPRAGVAAAGWVRFDTDKGAAPVVPAGTRVQAPAVPGTRESQKYEVAETTELHADWASLTATPVPEPAAPTGRELRFLRDPGFGAGDRVLLLNESEQPAAPVPSGDWSSWWSWLLFYYYWGKPAAFSPIALTVVEGRERELGTAVVTFDRDLHTLLPGTSTVYGAYRVVASAGSARRITHALRLTDAAATAVGIGGLYTGGAITTGASSASVVLDTALEDVSKEQLCAIVDWSRGACDVATISGHTFVEWEIAPGSSARVSRLEFATAVPALTWGGPVTAYVVDRRVLARHYAIPPRVPPAPAPARLRLYPAPAEAPPRVAVRSVPDGGEPVWEVFECARSAQQEDAQGDAPNGLVVDLLDGRPAGPVDKQPASGNVVRVRHGTAATSTLGSGDAIRAGQVMAVPKSPVAYDIGPDGTPVSTLVVRVDGLEWAERPSLYDAGPVDAYATTLDATGAVAVRFGDGHDGNRLPTGRNNVTAAYRVGGGTAGEVESGAIDSLVGSIRGVRGVGGVGPTSGGADQDDEERLRGLAPARARAFGRAVSTGDLADLALAFPGVSHTAAWHGDGPPGCACGRSGLHVAFVRFAGAQGVRAPVPDEVTSLSAYLDARRDVTVPLCVAAGAVTEACVALAVARDPRRAAGTVPEAVRAALLDGDGPLGPRARSLGRALDRSDVVGAVHAVPGVAGVTSLRLWTGTPPAPSAPPVERLVAGRYELLVVAPGSTVTEVVA